MLIVEDDDFKFERLSRVLNENGYNSIHRVTSVSEAIDHIEHEGASIIILDISLPSHPLRLGDISPTSMLSGGIEVIMNMQVRGHTIPVIIVTQYPEVEIEGRLTPVGRVRDVLKSEYTFDVQAVVHYQHEQREWEEELLEALLAR